MAGSTVVVDGGTTAAATESFEGKAKGQFGRGRDPLERVKKKQPKPLPELVPVDGEGLLKAMRHVLMNDDPRHDTDPLYKLAREMRAQDSRAFGKQFMEMERAEREGALSGGGEPSGSGSAAAPPAPDLGTAACLLLIDELLGEEPT